jgi:hypothetical protein
MGAVEPSAAVIGRLAAGQPRRRKQGLINSEYTVERDA